MKYNKIEHKNYDLYYCKTDKFKTINLTTILINNMDEKNITLDNFLSTYILCTSKKYNNEVLMNKKYMDLYNPNFSIYDVYRNLHLKFFDITFLSEKYLEKNNDKKVIEFYYDTIFNINENNKLDKKETNLIKEQMKTAYKLDEEDPSEKAYNNSIKLISEDIPLKINSKGNRKGLKLINTRNAFKYYKDELKNSRVVVFVTGNIDDNLLKIIDKNISNKINRNEYTIKTTYDASSVKAITNKIEESKFNESILYLIYKIPNITKREREIVLPLFNNILGGPSSRLFNNIREKNSLAYYAYSNYAKYYGILYMYAGISPNNYDKTTKLMEEILNDIKNGNLSEKEIKDSKQAIISTLTKTEDNIYSVVTDMVSNALLNHISQEEYKKEVVKVTKEEIIVLSKKLELDVVYLLKGVSHENN